MLYITYLGYNNSVLTRLIKRDNKVKMARKPRKKRFVGLIVVHNVARIQQ